MSLPKKVIIASENPVKINSVKQAFKNIYGKEAIDFIGHKSESGVPDQPQGEEETFLGAKNRVEYIHKNHPDADIWVGIEGGIAVDQNGEMDAFAWVVIESKTKSGKARTANFYIPKKVCELVKSGVELGHADDIIFGKSNSKQNSGSVGILTKGLVNRTEYYEQAVVLAMIPLLNPELEF